LPGPNSPTVGPSTPPRGQALHPLRALRPDIGGPLAILTHHHTLASKLRVCVAGTLAPCRAFLSTRRAPLEAWARSSAIAPTPVHPRAELAPWRTLTNQTRRRSRDSEIRAEIATGSSAAPARSDLPYNRATFDIAASSLRSRAKQQKQRGEIGEAGGCGRFGPLGSAELTEPGQDHLRDVWVLGRPPIWRGWP
jgi:hypothetical protein